MSYAQTESRTTVIRHLRNELEEVKKTCEKFDQLNGSMITLENNLRSLKEEKEAEQLEYQLKCQELTNNIREAEGLVTELREECKDGERVANEARAHMDRVTADLAFVEAKERSLSEKLETVAACLTDLQSNHNNFKDGTDLVKKEVAEMKANLTAIEKDTLGVEERISKLTLARRNKLAELNDLEAKERRLLQTRNERDVEKGQLGIHFNSRNNRAIELNSQLANLEEAELQVESERARIRQAINEVISRHNQEEGLSNEIRAEIHNTESHIKQVDDEQRVEDSNFIKAADRFNDSKERQEIVLKEAERLKACLFSLEELCGKVCSFMTSVETLHRPTQVREF